MASPIQGGITQRILETYDELGRDCLDLHTLFEFVGGNDPAGREIVLDSVAQLVKGNWLRAGPGSDFFTRTEEGRLAIAGPLDITLYSRPGCHLCDRVREVILTISPEFGARFHEVNIDEDVELHDLYTNDVPVILLGCQEVARHRVDPDGFRRLLRETAT